MHGKFQRTEITHRDCYGITLQLSKGNTLRKPSKYLETDQQTSKLIGKKKKENTMEI